MQIKHIRNMALAASLLASTALSQAALAVGANAPVFSTQSAMAGKAQPFDMAAALAQGPVVLLYAARDERHNNAAALRDYLLG